MRTTAAQTQWLDASANLLCHPRPLPRPRRRRPSTRLAQSLKPVRSCVVSSRVRAVASVMERLARRLCGSPGPRVQRALVLSSATAAAPHHVHRNRIFIILFTCIGGKNVRYSIIIGTVSLPAIETGHPETFKPARRERGETPAARSAAPLKKRVPALGHPAPYISILA